MALRIEDYALLGDTQSAALVGRDGSIDWMCMPRFDSDACFAALLGDEKNGRWLLAPEGVRSVTRRYRPQSLVLETTFETDEGAVRVVDCMPPREETPDLVRVVEGLSGSVSMRMELVIRFGYGSVLPWIRHQDGVCTAIAGPDALSLKSPVPLTRDDSVMSASFRVNPGDRVPFLLAWHPSNRPAFFPIDPLLAPDDTEQWWQRWASTTTYEGPWKDEVIRSLLTLKALTFEPTGGIVAAPTASLPEQIGGPRNWDYRYCWLRDATLTLYALMLAGFKEEAQAFCNWLLRAVAGHPSQMQIMYGPAGERRLTELQLPWLSGYEGSRPVRIGNAAEAQLQHDVFGEVMDTLHQARRLGIAVSREVWTLERALMDHVALLWRQPDYGIWEIRGEPRHHTHSKIMAWVAFDRAVKDVEHFGLEGPVDAWRRTRAELHAEICQQGYDPDRNTFVQSYGSRALDASLLHIPLVGFLPPDDPRVRGTIDAVERELCRDGLVYRYTPGSDGLSESEGAFLACSFWLVDALVLTGRRDEARALFEQLLALQNDVGLLSEEYDPKSRRMLGNFPQAFSHLALVNAAYNLSSEVGPADHRPKE